MIGILPEKAKSIYGVPDDSEVWTALAIAYPSPDPLETTPKTRQRKKLKEFVFSGNWGNPASFLS